jgi:putative restriction endonuclease
MKLCNLASFDPAATTRGRVGLKGASRLDREVWDAFQADWDAMGTESEERFNRLVGTTAAMDDEKDRWAMREGPTEAETVTRRRLGQDFFRRTVLVSYNHRCCITGTPIPALLSASHIVAWSADRTQRLNPRNGLCLAKTQDTAFDRHLITLDEDLRVVLSKLIRDHFTSESVRVNFQPYEGNGSSCRIVSSRSPLCCNGTGTCSLASGLSCPACQDSTRVSFGSAAPPVPTHTLTLYPSHYHERKHPII